MNERLPTISDDQRKLDSLDYLILVVVLIRNLYRDLVYKILLNSPVISKGNELLASLPENIPGGTIKKVPKTGAKYVAIIIRQAHLTPKGDSSKPKMVTDFEKDDPHIPKIKAVHEDIEEIILYFVQNFGIKDVFIESMVVGSENTGSNLEEKIQNLEERLNLLREMAQLLSQYIGGKNKNAAIKGIQKISVNFSTNGQALSREIIQDQSQAILDQTNKQIEAYEGALRNIHLLMECDATLRLARKGDISLKASKRPETMEISDFLQRAKQRENDAFLLMEQYLMQPLDIPMVVLTMGAAHNMIAARDRTNAPFALAIVTPNSYNAADFTESFKVLRGKL